MKIEDSIKVVLSIESAVSGGSISIVRDGSVVAMMHGGCDISRAEDILANIDRIVAENLSSKSEIELIAVSVGPGSFTGLRIGIATALGLKSALGIRCLGVPLLEAIAATHGSGKSTISAIPVGRSDVCVQAFTANSGQFAAAGDLVAFEIGALRDFVELHADSHFVVHSSLEGQFRQVLPKGTGSYRHIDAVENLSAAIATAAIRGLGLESLDPIYVQSPRFR